MMGLLFYECNLQMARSYPCDYYFHEASVVEHSHAFIWKVVGATCFQDKPLFAERLAALWRDFYPGTNCIRKSKKSVLNLHENARASSM